MPVPAPNLYPDFNVIRLSHTCLNVADLAASKAFYTTILGLQVTDEDDNRVYLRAMEERGHHCVILQKSDQPGTVEVMGFKTYDEDDLDRAEVFFKAKGQPTEWVERPYQGRTLLTRDNVGIPLEFYHKMDRLPAIHQQYALYRGVKPLRIDHFNCFTPDVDASVGFYTDMGFRVTEYTEDNESKKLWAAWMHRKGGVHDMAFTNGTGPRMHHVAFWVPTPLNIIDLLDLMATTGYVGNIERGPGRHGISNAFFLYILDPDGHRIEIYCSDYQTVDPDHEPIHWDLKDPQRQTLWGAPAPKSWFEHGTEFVGADTQEAVLKAAPIVAP
ncbi:3,4-dihydroxyphenylacetate 2,3-dioxygenase HpaD [Sulfitobacter noctilucae]|uniref:3,4-dihydroxyphenylacetate 2,3-dioxygenase n=1 Tax=Sulfitobacter noctilucae TaxID=1342302 RepID=UPI0004692C39|nr:3,4-dihydroxyphenylacetate 2,3-dioxygenase [Sulfitobacter noctilucae]KIN70495.1 3,4-dihydroxyphenylacetate 2,3-dioxygenase HpaD [Sulfitobacter noctilucae]